MKNFAPFKLMQWFGWLSSVIIIGIAVAHAWMISSFLTHHIFQREGELSRDFVQNILVADGSLDYLANPDDPELAARFANTAKHIQNLTDLLRANVYQADGTVLWSSDAELIGRKFPDENEELEEALQGELVIEAAHISEWLLEKEEHVGLDPDVAYFLECYIPVIDPKSGKTIGIVEFYRAPLALTQAIEQGRKQVWLAALASALALFVALYWIVRRADQTIKHQHERLVQTETLAVVGELTASVAHNIRNPLSSIRSAAELALEMPGEDCAEQARDIVREVDRISQQLTQLLNFSTENTGRLASVDLGTLIDGCIRSHADGFLRDQKHLEFSSNVERSPVLADEALLSQVLHSLISNAAEAMEGGGRCEIRLSEEGGMMRVDIEDSGPGIAPELMAQVFRPFFTTKPRGLGLGLPQARKIIERFGGTIAFLDNPGKGALVRILIPRA